MWSLEMNSGLVKFNGGAERKEGNFREIGYKKERKSNKSPEIDLSIMSRADLVNHKVRLAQQQSNVR